MIEISGFTSDVSVVFLKALEAKIIARATSNVFLFDKDEALYITFPQYMTADGRKLLAKVYVNRQLDVDVWSDELKAILVSAFNVEKRDINILFITDTFFQ